MLKLENLNTIEKLNSILKELTIYSIDISEYETNLKEVITKHEKGSNSGSTPESIENYEIKLYNDLINIEYNLKDYILFLDLIHFTKTWNLDIHFDKFFNEIENAINKDFLDNFYQWDTKKLIVEKYHDLLFKKILQDYSSGNEEYLERYRVIKNFPYLKRSIIKFLNDNSMVGIEIDEYDYDLEGILNKIANFSNNDNHKENYEVVKSKDNFGTYVFDEMINILVSRVIDKIKGESRDDTTKVINKLKQLSKNDFSYFDFTNWDLYYVDFTDQLIINSVFKGTRARINPQKVRFKSIRGCNLEGLDLSKADFYDVRICGANLKGTNAKINPQHVSLLDMWNCNLEGLDLSQADFNNVGICGTNFKGTKAKIDPQKINAKRIDGCNLEGLDLSKANFDGVLMTETNLRGTSARINPQTVKYLDLSNTCLEGCYVINNFKGYNEMNKPNLKGAILIDSFKEINESEIAKKYFK